MSKENPIASMLADMIHDTGHGDPWHRLEEATRGIRARDLTYKPVRVPWGWGRGRRRLDRLGITRFPAQNLIDILAVDNLLLQERFGQKVELIDIVLQDVFGRRLRLFDKPFNLGIDLDRS